MMEEQFRAAAQAIQKCEVLLIHCGAGMGVDSGLPDFRGGKGFWQAYPAYEKLGVNFIDMATPRHFASDPSFGWGFYGHRLELYRQTVPHRGFAILRDWIERQQLEWFVATSNVDGQFAKAGFAEERIYEIHGSIHYNQCLQPCSKAVWPNHEQVPVDLNTMRAQHIPHCVNCGGIARPNILMFGDWDFISERSQLQQWRYLDFISKHAWNKIVVVEIGAGTQIPSIRHMSFRLTAQTSALVIRINPRESDIAKPHIAIATSGLYALEQIAKQMDS